MPSYPTRLVQHDLPVEDSLKREVMTYFGHVCACPACGETRLSQLILDHKFGGGNAERRAMKRQGSSFYREVKVAIDEETPLHRRWLESLQPLCRTCHTSKGTGTACMIDHSMKNLNESENIDDECDERRGEEIILRNTNPSDETLVPFSTRVLTEVKTELLKRAKSRGVAAGVIIAELLTTESVQPWAKIEQKLNLLLGLVQKSGSGASHASPPADLDLFPWTRREKFEAWRAFETEWATRSQQPPAPRAPAFVSSRRIWWKPWTWRRA